MKFRFFLPCLLLGLTPIAPVNAASETPPMSSLSQCVQPGTPECNLPLAQRPQVYLNNCLTIFADLPNPATYCECRVSLDLAIEQKFSTPNVNLTTAELQEFTKKDQTCNRLLAE